MTTEGLKGTRKRHARVSTGRRHDETYLIETLRPALVSLPDKYENSVCDPVNVDLFFFRFFFFEKKKKEKKM